ncbi:uncharacterized protein LOC127784370 isoform X16 [Oryza glaberrima]|uniref:uncharacterized protein LOC127784370 isoform X16 n=1 Tax=Oryza glaberrima TaxID=4538 RepID=UPI00224C10EF|nr:uncharacterized protein LOC127784370 isoform X16 [Oryza glaberrima]
MAGLGTGAPIVKVYHEKSMILPDVSRVLTCLYEKDVKFEPCTTSYKSLLRLQASTHAPVPFYDGPTFLEESREICRYIAETYEHHGYPFLLGKDALERASIEQWLHHEEHAFNPPSRALFCHLAFPLDQEDDLEMQKAKLDEVLEVYEQRLSDSEFLAGNKFTLADLVHLPNSHYIKASGKFAYLYDSRKNVQRWWNAISTRHSWDQVLSYMTKVEQDNKLEELEKQKQQEWQREYHTATGRRTRLYSRKHTRTKSQTILVPPPDTVSASPMAPQGEQPPPADSLSEKASVFSSQSTTHKSIASPSKKTTSSTPSLGNFPSTADKPPRIHADMSSIRDVSVPPDTTETEHPTRSMLSSSKEVGTYIEPTPQKPPASLDNFSESDGPISGASHSQISPRTAKEDSDRLHASDLYRSDRKSTAHSYEATYGKSPTGGATDSSPNKLHSTEAHQMLQAEKWHAVQAGLRNLQGDIDNSVPSRQVKPSKEVQQYPSQDSEQVSIRPVAQEPLSMDGQLVQGPEGTAQTPHTDQTMGVSSPHWQHVADARRISEDEASSDRRIKGAHWSKHAADEDAQAIPFQTAHDDSQDTTQRARETDSVTRSTRDQDAHDSRQGIMTYDSAPSRLQPMDASHDAPLPSKKSTSQTPYTAAHIPTGYQGAQEFIQQGRERPKPRSVVPYDAQGSTEEEKMAESPPPKAQILGSRGLDVSPPKEVLNEDGYGATGPLQTRYGDDQDDWIQARDSTTPRHMNQDAIEETEMADSEPSKARTLDSQQAFPQKQPPAEDLRFAASTSNRRYFDDQDSTKKSKHTASIPRRMEAQGSLEETKAGESGLPREQPFLQAQAKDARSLTPPSQEGYAGPQAVSKQRGDPGSISRRIRAQDARVTFVESKADDSTFTREQPSDAWQATGPLPEHKVYDAQSSTSPFQDATMKSEDTTPQQRRGQGAKETKLSDSASLQVQPSDYQRSDSHFQNQEEIEDPHGAISPHKRSYTDVEDMTKHPGDKILGEDAQDVSEETKALDSTIVRGRAHPQDTHQAAIPPRRQAATKDALGVTPHFPTRYPTAEDTSRQLRRTASTPTEKAVQDGRDAFREWKSVDSTSSREQPSDVQRAEASFPKQEEADSHSTTVPFQRRYPDIGDTTKEPIDKPKEMVGEDAQAGFEETKALDAATQPRDTPRAAITPSKQVIAKDALSVTPLPPTRYPTAEDTSRQPKRTGSTPTEKAVQDGRDAFRESKSVDSTSSTQQPSGYRRAAASLPKQEAADSRSTPLPFQRRYPDVEHTTKEPRDKPKESVGEDAQDGFEETKALDSAIIRGRAQPQETPRAAITPSKQEAAKDALSGTPLSPTRYQTAEETVGEDSQDGFEETKALDSAIFRGRAQPQDTRRSAIGPPKLEEAKDALGATPHPPTRYPTAEDTSRQPTRTASTPIEKAVPDGRDAFRELKIVDSTSSREQPSDVRRAAASFRKQEAADSHSTTVPFQRRYPDIEDTTKEPRDKPKEKVSEEAQDGFEETKDLDSSILRGRAQSQGTQRAAITPPKLDAAKDAPGATPLPPTRYPTGEDASRQPRRTASTPTEKAVRGGRDDSTESKSVDSTPSREQPSDVQRAAASLPKQEAADSRSTPLPFQRRYPDVEHTTKEPRDKPKESVGEDAQDSFEETKALDSSMFRGRGQLQDTRPSAITPSKLEDVRDALGATPLPPRRYPTAEDTSRQPTRTASTPIEKAVPDGRDAIRELKSVDSTSSREQPSDVRRAPASLPKQEAADSYSTTVPFQRSYPDNEDTKEPRDKPKEKVSGEAQDGFDETKALDSSILRGRAQPQDTQRAAITPPKLDAAKDAPGATPFPPTRYPTGEDASRQPRRTASTPTEKAVRGGRDDSTESKSVDSTPSREQPSDVRRAAASLPKQEAADSRSTPLPFQRRYPDTRDTTKESRDKLKEAVGEDGQDGFEETKALDSAIIGGRAQPQETPRAAVTPSKLEGAKDALGVTPIAPTRYPTAEDTSKQSTRTASTPSEKAVPYGRDAFIESKSVDSTSSREQPSDVRRAAASLPKQEAADSRSTTMPFQRRYRDIEDTTKEPRDKPKETVGQDVQDTYEERVTTDSVLFTKQPSDMPRAAITPSKKAANDDAPSVSPPLPTRYPSAEDTSKQSIRPQNSRDVFREQKAVDSTSSPGPSDSLRASASLPNQEVDGTRRTTVPFQKREPELQNSAKPVNDSISTSWEMTAQDTQDTFEETKVPDSAAFSMPEVDSQRTDAEAQAEAQDTRDGGSRSRWWHASKTLPDGTPISGDDVTGLSPGDQMPTRMDQDAIPSTQIANGITERSIKQTAEPPAPVAPQTIFHQQARPSAPITKEVQASDNQGAISKIQQVSPDNHPTDYSAVPRVAAQEQVSHAPQTSPGREGITPAQREMDSPISDALPASAKVQEPAPDKSTMPFVSSVKQGSHVGRDVEPHEGPLPDTYGAVVDKETTKSLSWQDRSLEASPDSTPTHGYVHPTSRDEPAILPGQGAPQELTHPDALDSASTRDVTADSLVGPKKFKQRSTDQEDISFASNQTSGMGAQPYSSLDKVARAEQKSDLSDQDPSHSAQETVLAAAERTKALPKPIDQQETPDSRKPPTPDTQYASQIIPSQEKVAPDVPSQEKVSQAELSLKPHEGSTPHMHGSIVDEKKTRPLASPTKSSNDVLDLTPAGADVHPTSSTEPPRSALPVQAQTPSATQTPPPFASHKSVRTEDIRADANGKVKSVKPSASPDAPHATAPGEVALSEQKLASAGRDSSRAAQLPSSDEPRNEQIKDSDHTAQPFSSAAPDQAKDLQRTFGQPDISRAPGTSESPYSDVYDGARKVDPDYQLIDKTIPSQEQVSHPDLASKTNEGPTETPGPAPLMDVYDSISTQYIQDGDLDKDQDSANFAQKYSSSEPKEEESTVAAPDQTKEIQTTVGQQDILPAVSKEKDPSSGIQYDSMEVQEVAPKDQHIDGSIPSHEQAPNVEEPMTHITGPTSALDTQHGMTSDQDSYQYPELPSSAKSRKETDVAEADKTKAKQMTFGQPVPVPSDATRSVTDQGAQQPQRPAKIESPPFLETIKNYEYTQNVSDETLDKNKSSGKPSADQEVMSPKVVPATFLDPQRVTVPDDEQKIAKPDLTRSAQPPFSAEPTKRKTVVGASDQAKASETIVDLEGQEHGSFSEGSTTDSRDAITDESATTSTSGREKVLDASILTATHDDAHPPTVRNLPEHETQAPASTQSASVEASDKAKSTDQEDMKPMASQASILDTQRGTNGDKPIARFLHDQGAQSPELTHPQQPPESPPHSASQHDAPTDVLDKTKMTKLTSTNQEGMAPTAGSRSTLESQPDGTFAAEVVHDEQKSTVSDQESARATQPLSSVERSKEDTNVSAADQPEVPQTIFHQKARSSVPVTREVQFPDSLGAISKIQEVSPDNQSTDYSAVQPVPTKEQVLHAPQTSPDQEGITPAQGEKDSPIPDAQLVPHALQDKGSPRSTQPPPPIESSEKESQIAEDGQTVLLQSSVVQESTPSLAGPRESSSSDSPYPSAENQVSTPKAVEPLPPTTGMMDRVQPSSEATPGVVAGISATPGDNKPSPDRESVEVAEEGTDQQKADQASVQSPQDNMGQVKETEEQDTGTGQTYQATVQSPQDIKEQSDETEQQDTRTGEAYQDAPAPDAPQDKGLPRSTQPPPPIESSQKESEIAEDSQTLLPQSSVVQESTPSSAGPRESSSSDSPYPSAENQVSTPKVVEPLPPTTGMMDRVQPSSEATPGVVAGISATPGDNKPSPDRESVEVAEEGTDQQKADQASVQSPQDKMGQVKETEEQDTGTGETYQASVQSPQDIKEQRDETEQQDTRTGEAYQDAPAADAPQDKGLPRSTQPPPPVESSQKESEIAEDSQTLLPQASAVQESTPSSAGPRESTPYPSVEDQGSAPKAVEPLPPTTGMMDRVQPSSEATPGVVAGISATPGDNKPSPDRESAEVAEEGTDQQKADQASVQSPQDKMGQVKETEEQDTGTGETYQASVQSPQDIKDQRDETEQQDTRTGEAYQDAPAADAPQDKGLPRSTQPPPPVESSQKESEIAEDSQTLLPQASAVQESTPSSAGPRESTPYPSVEDQGSAPKAVEPLPPTTGMMDRVQPSSEATPGVVAGISATPGDNQPSPDWESAEVAEEGTDQQKADQASVQSPQDNMGQVKETEEQDTGTGETYQATLQPPQDIKEQRDETEQQDTRTGEAYQDAPAPDAPQDKGLPRSTQPPPPVESSQKESEIAEDSQTLLPQASAVQESTPSSAGPRESTPYPSVEDQGSAPKAVEPLPPTTVTGMMDRVQPSSEATPGVVAGISATPGDNQPSPDWESAEVAEEGTDQQKADQASVQSPQDNMGQVKETEEQDTGTGETYQATLQPPQDIKEQRDETEQQDTRTGEAYQDAPAPDAPQDKGSPRSTQPPPPVESSQKESKIAEDSQTLLPQASAIQESTPSSAGPRESTPYPSVEDQGSAPMAEEPLPPTTGMMDRVQPSSEATPGVVAGISATPGDNQPSLARESAEVAKEGTDQQKANQASVQSPQDNMGQVKETEEQDTGTGETYQASVQSPQDIKEQRDETEQQDTRTGEAYQDAPAPDAPQDKGLPRSTQPPPPVESSQKESEIAEDSQTILPQASAVQESTPSSAGPRDSLSLDSSYSLMENRGSVPNVGKPLPPSTDMMDRVQPSLGPSLEVSSDEKTTVPLDGLANNLSNVSPSVTASQVLGRSENDSGTGALSGETVPSNSQENSEGTPSEEISKQQPQTNMSSTKLSKDDNKEADGSANDTKPGDSEDNPSR